MLRFDKGTYLSLLLTSTLSERLSNSLSGSDVFRIFRISVIHKYSIHSVLQVY